MNNLYLKNWHRISIQICGTQMQNIILYQMAKPKLILIKYSISNYKIIQ